MALLPTLAVPGEERLTPDQIERLRQSSGLAAQRGADTSPISHWSAGLARLVDAYGGYKGNIRAGEQESAGLEKYQDWQSRLGTAQSGLNPVVSALTESMQNPQAGNFPASLIETESGGNWNALNNEQGAGGRGHGGRLQFGHARLQDAANAGVIQPMTPQQFAQQPPEVQQAVENWHFADIDNQSARMGLNNFIGQNVGGVPITQDGIRAMAHLGGIGGAKRFLESGGVSNPSDSFGTSLRDYAARHGGQGGMTQSAGLPQSGGQSSEIAALLAEGMADPWIRHHGGPVIEALMGQQMQQQNAAYQQQMRQADPMYQAQLQHQQLQNQSLMNPQVDPFAGTQVINSQLVGMGDGGPQVLGDFRTPEANELPGAAQTLAWRAQEAGLQPGTPEYQQFMVDNGGGQTINNILGGEGLTPGQKKIDEAFADTYLDWTGGGFADVAKQTEQLQEAISILDNAEGNVTGAIGALPQSIQAFVNPQGTIAREAVEEVVQRSLREILGAQFTEKEGERLIARAYNPLLKPEENRKRVNRLLGQISTMAEARQAMVDYFDENGTLRGYRGNRPSAATLDSLMASDDEMREAGFADGDAVPAGVDADVWAVMTPEERALFQ